MQGRHVAMMGVRADVGVNAQRGGIATPCER